MSGNGDSGGNYGGGSTTAFDCSKVSIKTNIISPNPIVLDSLNVGDYLDVVLQTTTGPLLAVTTTGEILGSIFTIDPASIISCINEGFSYQAQILKIDGGNVEVLITNK